MKTYRTYTFEICAFEPGLGDRVIVRNSAGLHITTLQTEDAARAYVDHLSGAAESEVHSSGGPVMSTKHTPGPWRAAIFEGAAKYKMPLIAIDQDSLSGRPNVAFIGLPADCGASLDECRANARLIAAGPEMLEALKGMVVLSQRWLADFGDDAPAAEKYRAVLAAIRKAEGQS